MFRNILVPTDGSDFSLKAAGIAIELAKALDAKLVCISVSVPYVFVIPSVGGMFPGPDFYNDDLQRLHDEQELNLARTYVQKVVDMATDAGVFCEEKTVASIHPYEEIVNAINSNGCDLVIMASHGKKGIEKWFLGSETQKVIAKTTVPVMVIH